jgi:SAM-dependent methyltransferase
MSFDHKEIYSLAKHYDRINDFDFDIPFYQKHAAGKKVLELGCGTGRVCIPLAKAGTDITGIDVSDEMLEEAKLKAKNEKLAIDFQKEDIIHFQLEEKFDLILCIHNSFSHVNGLENLRLFFDSVKRNLTNDGTFILQVFNPDFYFFTRDPEEKYPLKTYQDPYSDEMVELLENNYYDDESQINYMKWYFQIGDKEIVKSFNQRVYFPQELDYLVQLFGFEIVDKFGDFEETPFVDLPDTQVLVLKIK